MKELITIDNEICEPENIQMMLKQLWNIIELNQIVYNREIKLVIPLNIRRKMVGLFNSLNNIRIKFTPTYAYGDLQKDLIRILI